MKSRKDLPILLNTLGLIGSGVEVGVCRGSFSRTILEKWKGHTLYSVDPWIHQSVAMDVSDESQVNQDDNLRACREALRPFKLRSCIIRKTSTDAAKIMFDSFDFVYIDARHDYRSVTQDLKTWWPKIKKGGLLSGHDYKNSCVRKNLVEVKRAVDNFAFEFGLKVNSTTEDNLPSWYIFKS
jgi:hypothetical protein